MDRHGQKGSVTVFLSLTCILFLSLICALAESARVQGAKAQTANITGMGTFSVLGEYERELLEKYNLFSLDGTYRNGSFQISKVKEQLEEYISYNADPKKDKFSLMCFDPWNLELTDTKITGYTLLTDKKGEPFYQQAVAYMKTNAAVIAVDKLMEYAESVNELEENQKNYEDSQKSNDDQVSDLEQEKQKRLEQMEKEAENAGEEIQTVENPPASIEEPENPLKEIAKLRRMTTLEIVTWDKKISEKKIKSYRYPSHHRNHSGNMDIVQKNSGLLSDVLFREYLMMNFKNYQSEEPGNGLDYQIEYILGGKANDRKNLQFVVNRLLLIREGMNYAYCLKNPEIQSQTEALALTLTGFLGIPPLTAATKHALMLAWAYGESLIDVRVLLDHGKVPLTKTAGTWSLSLENLGHITEILKQGAQGNNEGFSYEEYLRILLNMGNLTSQKMRGLDMIQTEMQALDDYSDFKADNCIVAVKAAAYFDCKPVFFSLPKIVFGIADGTTGFAQESSMSY